MNNLVKRIGRGIGKLAVGLSLLSSCEDYTEEIKPVESPFDIMEIKYDSVSNVKNFFGKPTGVFSEGGEYDVQRLFGYFGVMNYKGWPLFFNQNKDYNRYYVQELKDNLDLIEKNYPQSVRDSLKSKMGIYLDDPTDGNYAGQFYFIEIEGQKKEKPKHVGIATIHTLYPKILVLSHEIGHGKHRLLSTEDFDYQRELWNSADSNNTWRGEYMGANFLEYFAEAFRKNVFEREELRNRDRKTFTYTEEFDYLYPKLRSVSNLGNTNYKSLNLEKTLPCTLEK